MSFRSVPFAFVWSCAMAVAACGDTEQTTRERATAAAAAALSTMDTLPADARLVEHVAYNDANDMWRVWFLAGGDGAPPPMLRQRALKLARLSDAQVRRGLKAHVRDVAGEPVAFLPADFRVDLFHGVIDKRLVPGTTDVVDVVVGYRQQAWQPLLARSDATGGEGAVDGLALPGHFYPPLWTGRPLVGFAATGRTLEDARQSYRRTLGVFPQAVTMEKQGFLEDLPDAGPPTDAGPPVPAERRRRRARAGEVPVVTAAPSPPPPPPVVAPQLPSKDKSSATKKSKSATKKSQTR